MTNIQQPEMRRNGKNPTVQDSKGPESGGHPLAGGDTTGGRPIPAGQASEYGPQPRRVADDGDNDD